MEGKARTAIRIICGAVSVVAVSGVCNAAQITFGCDATVQQEAIYGSITSGGTYSTRIAFNASGESRGVYEFYLPTLPAGGAYTGAAISYSVLETNSGGSTASQLRFFSYAGNGRYDAGDPNNVSQTAGLSGMHFTTGLKTTTLITANVTSLYGSGANWLGLNTWQEQYGYMTGVGRGTFGSIIPRVQYTAAVPDSGTLVTRPRFDGQVSVSTGPVYTGSFDGTSINTQSITSIVDRRGVMEFSLGGLPDGAVITGASITFDVASLTSGSQGGPRPRIYGYTGDGVADVADVANITTLLATSPAVNDLGPTTITLNATAIQNLLSAGDNLGIVVRGSENGQQFGFDTLEYGTAPSLSISYAVPEPGCIALAAAAAGVLALPRRRTPLSKAAAA